jgi:tetratricopeptide (TPR) repeat protein
LGLGYGLGMGLGGFGGYGGYGGGGYGGGGYGGSGYGGGYGGGYGSNYASNPNDYGYDSNQFAQATAASEAATFDQAGEQAFQAGQYRDAAYDFRHALVDDQQNGVVAMMLAQALFAQGSYNEAAAATELGMVLLPQDQWGIVVKNYKELYPNNATYTQQLRAAEQARNAKPDDPALRFVLGFQFNYLGYPTQAAKEVEKAVQLMPHDEFSKRLLDAIHGKTIAPTPPTPAASQATPGGE